MAHTIRLWPRPMSPATNTPGTLVMNAASRATLPRASKATPRSVEPAAPLRADEAHRQQHELARQLEVGALDLLEAAVDHLDLVRPQRAHVAVVVADEALGVDREDPLAALFVGRRRALHQRPRRPRVGVGADVGRPGQDLELVDDAAPWRCAVPRQSAPVSPPPMITTCLPSARDRRSARSPCCTRLAGGRYSIAWWMPFSSRPGTGRSRHAVAPAASTTAS